MSEPLDRYTRISQGFEDRLRGVRDDQWTDPTPCTEWDVRALVAHLIGSHQMMLTLVDQTHAAPGDGDDLFGFWTEARQAVIAALSDETVAHKVVQAPFGEAPFEDLAGGLLCGDTLFHTWDLARATGQNEHLDAQAVDDILAFLTPLDEAIRMPGFFGPKLDAPQGADTQSRLLYFGGRKP